MNTYKITNITDSLGKRDTNFNTTLKIGYVDGMIKKTILLKPKDTVFFTAKSLPLSLHRFRVKKLVSIAEISNKELKTVQEGTSKSVNKMTTVTTSTTKKPKPKVEEKVEEKKTAVGRKSTTKKTSTDE